MCLIPPVSAQSLEWILPVSNALCKPVQKQQFSRRTQQNGDLVHGVVVSSSKSRGMRRRTIIRANHTIEPLYLRNTSKATSIRMRSTRYQNIGLIESDQSKTTTSMKTRLAYEEKQSSKN